MPRYGHPAIVPRPRSPAGQRPQLPPAGQRVCGLARGGGRRGCRSASSSATRGRAAPERRSRAHPGRPAASPRYGGTRGPRPTQGSGTLTRANHRRTRWSRAAGVSGRPITTAASTRPSLSSSRAPTPPAGTHGHPYAAAQRRPGRPGAVAAVSAGGLPRPIGARPVRPEPAPPWRLARSSRACGGPPGSGRGTKGRAAVPS